MSRLLRIAAACLGWVAAGPLLAADAPARIVSLGAQVTETLFALGMGDAVVAVDDSSLWPPEAAAKPRVGYYRTLGAEGLLSMRPNLIIGNSSAGPASSLDKVRAAGIPVALLSAEPTVDDALALIHDVATIIERESRGETIVHDIRTQLDRLQARLQDQPRPRVLSLMAAQGGTPLAAGRDTNAALMIELAGGHNVGAGFDGYKPLTAESVVALAPEVIVVPQHIAPQLGGIEGIKKLPAFAATPAVAASRIVIMDSVLLLGLGPRIGIAAEQLAQTLHPELSWSAARD